MQISQNIPIILNMHNVLYNRLVGQSKWFTDETQMEAITNLKKFKMTATMLTEYSSI